MLGKNNMRNHLLGVEYYFACEREKHRLSNLETKLIKVSNTVFQIALFFDFFILPIIIFFLLLFRVKSI